jgi:hypothetical protein
VTRQEKAFVLSSCVRLHLQKYRQILTLKRELFRPILFAALLPVVRLSGMAPQKDSLLMDQHFLIAQRNPNAPQKN